MCVCMPGRLMCVCTCVYANAFQEPDKPKKRWKAHRNDQCGRLD